jgi:hypothetical protein
MLEPKYSTVVEKLHIVVSELRANILQFWNWWQFRKSFYWFSPEPCPVEWYEYFFVVLIVIAFSSIMEKAFIPVLKGFAKRSVNQLADYFLNIKEEDEEIGE